MNKLIVFTDLDGTLLDHNDYGWEGAKPALAELESNLFPVIINSSKTAAEIIEIRKQINNFAPFICENGTVANIPKYHFSKDFSVSTHQSSFDVHNFGKSYTEITSILRELREKYKFRFRGFNNMSVDELMLETSLDRIQAENAMQRQGAEPIIWLDSEKQLDKFKSLLKVKALTLTSGGRFYHVMSPVDKGQAVKWLSKQYKNYCTRTNWKSVGLGDSFNDVSMLESVDYPILINNPAAIQPDVSHIKNIRKMELSGPDGWGKAVLEILGQFT